MTGQYVPILKAREAEVHALLAAPSGLVLTPYFELQNAGAPARDPATGLPRRTKSALTDASYFFDDLTRIWRSPFYVDASRVATSTSIAVWWGALTAMAALKPTMSPIPALSDRDTDSAWVAAAPLAVSAGRAAIRVRLPHANPSVLGSRLLQISSLLGLATSQIDVVLDWGDQMEASVVSLDNLAAATAAVVMNLTAGHGSLITMGTPNSRAFVQAGRWSVTRREWWLWLRKQSAGHDVTYGDYALYPPADPVPAAPRYGHLRYSSGDLLHVHRNAIPRGGGGLAAAFRQSCTDLLTSSHYLGRLYSPADTQFSDIAAGVVDQGKPGEWRKLAAVHHFALVHNQLLAPPAAPAVGTP